MKIAIICFLLPFFATRCLSQNIDSILITQKDTISNFPKIELKNDELIVPENRIVSDKKRLLNNTICIFGGSLAAFGILYAMPESVTNWNKSEMKISQLGADWWEHVKAGPVWDHDRLWLNYLAHPYCGALYFMTARSTGYNFYQSMAYSFCMSTFSGNMVSNHLQKYLQYRI